MPTPAVNVAARGARRGQVAPAAQHRPPRRVDEEVELDEQRLRADRVQPELELGHDAEVAAAAAQAPEQLGVLVRAGAHARSPSAVTIS